jgi:cysteine desulfuration protein SufE
MTSISEREAEIIDEFSMMDDWMDKYEHLIAMGKSMDSLPLEKCSEDLLVKGCQSRVWVDTKAENNLLKISANADALIAKGIVALLVRVYSEQPLEDVAKADGAFIDAIGLRQHLSPNRTNGLLSMLNSIRSAAALHLSKS